MTISRRSFTAVCAAALAVRAAVAAEWPADHPIVVVVPFPPGGGVDQMTRVVLPYVQKHLPGANFIVENRAGAASQVGMEYVFNSKPDGYTLCAVTSPAMMTLPFERSVRYRVAEFVYIANIVDDPGALWVRKASPIRDLADLLDRAKKEPGAVSLGTTGVGSDDHLLLLEIEQAVPGATFNHALQRSGTLADRLARRSRRRRMFQCQRG
jgi:tripartite-type tricarboxylate transporter receptor subunit TctC